ncbi:hypothetical protein GCM10017673_31490 [Streptosporangium violaceochromogenes]|nr:hypothetical protein GCM10017673_31490 [Streptosporangium violaceochromogenes]
MPETADFWTKKLGFTQEFAEKDFASVTRDGVTLYISWVEDQVVPDNTQAWVSVRGLEKIYAEWAAVVSTDFSRVPGPAADSPFGGVPACRGEGTPPEKPPGKSTENRRRA